MDVKMRTDRKTNHTRVCTICGAEFACYPSEKTKTCSPECQKKQASLSRVGKRYERNNGIIGKGNDLTGKTYNDLKVLEPAGIKNRRIIWRCECLACGKIRDIAADSITSGATKSCGCRRGAKGKENIMGAVAQIMQFDTNLSKLGGTALNINNTSGYTGVYLNKKTGTYRATIIFRKKYYNLGTSYKTAEEAAKVRKEAEQRLHAEFLEWYDEWKKNH